MKKILSLLLAMLMVCTLGMGMIACGDEDDDDDDTKKSTAVTLEAIAEKCAQLLEDGEIADYNADDDNVYVEGNGGEMFSAQEYEDEASAKEAVEEYESYSEIFEEYYDSFTVVRKGKIVICYTDKALYNKLV